MLRGLQQFLIPIERWLLRYQFGFFDASLVPKRVLQDKERGVFGLGFDCSIFLVSVRVAHAERVGLFYYGSYKFIR